MATWRDFVDEVALRDNIAAAYAMPLVSARRGDINEQARVNQHLQKLFDAGEISINMPKGPLDDFVTGGVYKTVFDLPPVEGFEEYLLRREAMEVELFGEKSRSIRPVAGYISNVARFTGATGSYGKIRVMLKPEARQRTTITRTDLMNMLAPRVAVPFTEIDAVVFGAMESDDLLAARSVSGLLAAVRLHHASEYIEAQVHGGVILSDILRLEYLEGYMVGAETKRWAEREGIEISPVR